MGILLIDTSSKKIEFGYANDSEILINEELSPEHNADMLTYFLKKSFDKQKISFNEVEIVTLSNGPGSFTGLRIGSAIAKGICFANGSKLIELSTLDIIANKHKTAKKIISLIFSNSKTFEFYYCEYRFESVKLKKISDYKVGLAEDIFKQDAVYLINKNVNGNIPEKYKNRVIDVSDNSNIYSMFELTKDFIKNKNSFADYRTSEPFYMKEFVPKI